MRVKEVKNCCTAVQIQSDFGLHGDTLASQTACLQGTSLGFTSSVAALAPIFMGMTVRGGFIAKDEPEGIGPKRPFFSRPDSMNAYRTCIEQPLRVRVPTRQWKAQIYIADM